MSKRIFLIPLDPVHDVAVKVINRMLKERGHITELMPPDLPMEELIEKALAFKPDALLISRTLGYGVAELLSKFLDQCELAGLRENCRLAIGGKAIHPELAAELGFDGGFGAETAYEEIMAWVEERPHAPKAAGTVKKKINITEGYSYKYLDREIQKQLEELSAKTIDWAAGFTSPGVRRAEIRQNIFAVQKEQAAGWRDKVEALEKEYREFCDPKVAAYFEKNEIPAKVRLYKDEERSRLDSYITRMKQQGVTQKAQHTQKKPLLFVQYGTGCPIMDIEHIKVSEGWGADGVFHFDPSWGARTEGFFSGCLAHEEDGSIITEENLRIIKSALNDSTLWAVRGHRGLNTPETVLLAGQLGADLTKINIAYGSLNGGTDPERLTVDGLACVKYAAQHNLAFDIVTNEELGGVPAPKAFAGMLAVAHIALKLGGRPILKPLFCYSPDVMLNGYMEENFVDYNIAKVKALREIIDAPIWPGEPIGFMTHSEDRVQSSMATAFHAALGISLGVAGITVASSDEAYSRGPISVAARVDTLRAVKEAYRFMGQAQIKPGAVEKQWRRDLRQQILAALKQANTTAHLAAALNAGCMGSREDGAYPGRAGRGTLIRKQSA